MGAFVLFTGLVGGRLRGAALREVLHHAIAITGALFALLIAATTFTLMLRLLGTDRLVADWSPAFPATTAAVVRSCSPSIGLCAFVLDAFEIIFVIVPIVIPPLLVRVADARWVAVLVLLTLQSSFLLPPFGYALMMVRGAARNPAPFRRIRSGRSCRSWSRNGCCSIVVLLVPKLVHFGENAAESTRAHGRARLHRGNRPPHAARCSPRRPEIEPK